ncbi:MAG TPA: hypothetical protein VFJ82_11785 [Longimicrobium sp.]|nr:hypothetical protein [Longimicrobium sp.]
MKRRAVSFWGSAVGAGTVFALLVPVLFPFRALGLSPAADRGRVWLLTVFCTGVMALLFGISGALGGRFLGIRDVYFAGSAREAVERHEQSGEALKSRGWMNAGVWTVAFGASLIAIYFVLFLALS